MYKMGIWHPSCMYTLQLRMAFWNFLLYFRFRCWSDKLVNGWDGNWYCRCMLSYVAPLFSKVQWCIWTRDFADHRILDCADEPQKILHRLKITGRQILTVLDLGEMHSSFSSAWTVTGRQLWAGHKRMRCQKDISCLVINDERMRLQTLGGFKLTHFLLRHFSFFQQARSLFVEALAWVLLRYTP